MLSAIREIRANGIHVAKTPVLVPSFSSKGFPEVGKIIDTLSQTITESTLISAYDVARGFITNIPTFPLYFFLDSGGYECSKDTELSDTRMNTYTESAWSIEELKDVLDSWKAPQQTIAVSYDHPRERDTVVNQIARAKELFKGRTLGKELLIKPSTNTAERVDIPSVISSIRELHDFDVIGFTEKELGYSIFDRMKKISEVRQALTAIGLHTPIHIFGSLDQVSTPLYFLAGADIFDGLTWLRYAYIGDQAVYGKNASALKYGIRQNDKDIDPRVWAENYQAISNLQISMKRFIKENSFSVFGEKMGSFFEKALKELHADS